MRGRTITGVLLLIAVSVGMTLVVRHRIQAEADASEGAFKAHPAPLAKAVDHAPRGNLLLRELVRQAWLVAQRDELGLSTRDATLREPRLVGGAAVPDISVRFIEQETTTLATIPGTGDKGEWKLVIPEGKFAIGYAAELITVERLSRTDFVEAIQGMGFAGARRQPSEGRLPDLSAARVLLDEMNICAQFEAVRTAHELARAAGLSPAAEAVLVLGYSNLSQLTRPLWNATSQVFAARALIYAQRMVVEAEAGNDAAKSNALRHRAYAFAMAGFHENAGEDLDAADKLAAARDQPEWLPALRAFSRYKTAKLADITVAADASKAQLPAFLTFLTIEHTNSLSAVRRYGELVLRAEPDNAEVLYAMDDISGNYANNGRFREEMESTARVLCLRSPKMRGAPAAAIRAAEQASADKHDPKLIAAIPKAFVDAGAADRGEPSWSALGRVFQDLNFRNVFQQIYFEARFWVIDPSVSFNQLEPLIAGHPYAAGVKLIALHPKDLALGAELVKDVIMVDPQFKMTRFLAELHQGGVMPRDPRFRDFRDAMVDCKDETTWDAEFVYRYVDEGMKNHAVEMLAHCYPEHPAVIAQRVRNDWPKVEQQAVRMVADGEAPVVAYALGEQYSTLKDWTRAEKYLRTYLEVCPDREAYQLLAADYLAQGNEDRWLATLTEALGQPGFGLDDARINVAIIEHYVKDERYADAQPFAEAAAESGAGWAMTTAADVYEKLGKWDEAENLIRGVERRYGPKGLWLEWCRRTGHGDKAAAEKVVKDR